MPKKSIDVLASMRVNHPAGNTKHARQTAHQPGSRLTVHPAPQHASQPERKPASQPASQPAKQQATHTSRCTCRYTHGCTQQPTQTSIVPTYASTSLLSRGTPRWPPWSRCFGYRQGAPWPWSRRSCQRNQESNLIKTNVHGKYKTSPCFPIKYGVRGTLCASPQPKESKKKPTIKNLPLSLLARTMAKNSLVE